MLRNIVLLRRRSKFVVRENLRICQKMIFQLTSENEYFLDEGKNTKLKVVIKHVNNKFLFYLKFDSLPIPIENNVCKFHSGFHFLRDNNSFVQTCSSLKKNLTPPTPF